MFFLVLKKWFYECWDNLLVLLLSNLLFVILLTVGAALFASTISIGIILPFIGLGFMAILGIYSLVVSSYLAASAWEHSVSVKDILVLLKKHWRSGLLGGLIMAIFFILLWVAVPFYGTMSSVVASLAVGILFWGAFLWFISIQYYAPLRVQMGNRFAKLLKKCFLLSLDNLLFSIALFFCAMVFLGISIFTIFLFPGPAGILHLWQVGLKLRLYKYDSSDTTPDWDTLLQEEKEKLGHRTLRGFIFPWKD